MIYPSQFHLNNCMVCLNDTLRDISWPKATAQTLRPRSHKGQSARGRFPDVGKKKWFESVHVSLTLIQGRIKDFYCGRRRMWGGKRGHQKLRKLGVQKGVEEIMSRRIQQGPLFMQVVLATSFVTEPKRAFFLLCDQYINTAKQCQTVHQFFPIEWSELIKAILY